MTVYTMYLIADFSKPQPIPPTSQVLRFCFTAKKDPDDHTYEVLAGDEARVVVLVKPALNQPTDGYEILAFNLVSWRSHRLPDQLFDGMLRDNQDNPDRKILSSCESRFEPLATELGIPEDATPYHGDCSIDLPFASFEMNRPNRLVLDRPGLYGFLLSLTIRDPEGNSVHFIIDPELDVGGTYPPD
ncbi:MAG TPA: hypothetical protein VKU40_10470 [Thermoanaerobaculia bacterium]|nr:hypothetical protein [Thermoanaerobaculia bacterium]